MKDANDKKTLDFLSRPKDPTAAARMARMRAKKAKDFPVQLRAAYLRGFDDALAGKRPASAEHWIAKDDAIAYICGGMDGSGQLSKVFADPP